MDKDLAAAATSSTLHDPMNLQQQDEALSQVLQTERAKLTKPAVER